MITKGKGAQLPSRHAALSPPRNEPLPVDMESVDDTVNAALAITLAMPDRPGIDTTIRKLIGHLSLLVAEDLRHEDAVIRGFYSDAHRLLELSRRPGEDTPHFGAFQYMRDLATLTKRFACAYREQFADGECDG